MLVSGLPSPAGDSGRPMKRSRNYSSFESAYDFSTSASLDSTPKHDLPHREARDKNPNRKLSCRECRRLKLKCDRNFPCQSCRKRGCGDICPDGALTSGRGSRFILANTGQLHAKISQLSDRVRRLEDALREECGPREHGLLAPELLQLKTIQEFYGVSSNASTSQTAGPFQRDGESLHQAVNTLSLTNNNDHLNHYIDENDRHRTTGPPQVPPDVLQLSVTFPFPWSVDLRIRKRIRDALPPREEAQEVCKEAKANALWQYNLDASETFLSNLLHHCYESQIEDLSPRRLALLLMILSIGSLVDLNKPLGNLYGEAYHHLARASVCEIPLMEEPDFDTLHALFFMIWYHLIFSDNRKAVGYAWNLMGFVAKLAQGLGLHREGSRVKRIPEEHEKRRYIFWELLNLDCRMSLSLGRPPSICLAHVDIKAPTFDGPGLYVPQEEIIYHGWKTKFFIHCLTPILEAILAVGPNVPPYQKTLELDSMVRDFDIPDILRKEGEVVPSDRFIVMQRALVSMGRDIALLQLHRRHFIELMSRPASPGQFDWNNVLAPSVVATYLGSSSIIAAVETLFNNEEQLSGRFLCFWFNAFSASVTLSLLVSREPSCALAPCALTDLDRVCRLFRRAAIILPFSARTLPVIEKMLDKCRRAYHDSKSNNNNSGIGGISSQLPGTPLMPGFPCPYLTPAFDQAHYSLIRYLQDLYDNPPPPPPPVLLAPSPSRGLGLPSSSSGFGFQPSLPGFESTGAFRTQGFDFDSFAKPPLSYLRPHYHQRPPVNEPLPWLPNIYSFNTVGHGVDEEYDYREKFAMSPPTPFTPSSPRVVEDEDIHLDYGALMTDLEETSYMAWF